MLKQETRRHNNASTLTRAIRCGLTASLLPVVLGVDIGRAEASFPAVIDLSTTSLNGQNGFNVSGSAAEDGIDVIASAGDINGDGNGDLIFGKVDLPDDNSPGAAYVVFGRQTDTASVNTSALDGSNGFKMTGENAGDDFGKSVSSAGDFNNDGYDDLVVGADFHDSGSKNLAGAAYVVFGSDNLTSPLSLASLDGNNGFEIGGESVYDTVGKAVAAAGDINGDGFDDIVVGSRYVDDGANDGGAAYVVFGSDTVPSQLDLTSLDGNNGFKIYGQSEGDEVGYAVSGAGDINGDGLADLIIGSPKLALNNSTEAGGAYVIFGRSNFTQTLDLSALDGTDGFTVSGITAGDGAGRSVSAVGDIDGDGIDDFAVGAPGVANYAGAVYVIFGSSTFASEVDLGALDGSNGFTVSGANAYDSVGADHTIAGLSDINGDGTDDLLLGASLANSYAGAAYVIFSRAAFGSDINVGALDGTNGFSVTGRSAGDLLGRRVASAVNFFGDGTDGLFLGAPGANSDAGAAYVVYPNQRSKTSGSSPQTSISESALNFGALPVSVQAEALPLTVTNAGTGTLSILQLSIVGSHAQDFEIVLDACSNSRLSPGESCAVQVRSTASAAGARRAALNIPSNAGTQTVNLSVEGVPPKPVPVFSPGWTVLMAGLLGALGVLGHRMRARLS